MATITSPGLGSGLDVNALVSQLIAAESQVPTARLDRREAGFQARLSGFGTLKSSLSALQSSLSGLRTVSSFQGKTASSSDSKVLTATASSSAALGNHSFDVTQLAVSHKTSTDPLLANAQFTSTTDVVGTGTLTFRFGTTVYDTGTDTVTTFTQGTNNATKTVNITDGSLIGIVNAVNDANIGVNASIIFDGTNQRLVFASTSTGADNSFEVTVDDDDLNDTDTSGLSLLSFNTTSSNLLQTDAALDANVTIDGISGIKSASNTLTDIISGLTITLLDTTTSPDKVTLTVGQDTDAISSNVSNFVSNYNALITTINDLDSFNPDTREAGLLNGEGVLRSVQARIRRIIGTPVAGLADAKATLSSIGITTSSSDGTLVLDNTKLQSALDTNINDVTSLFAGLGNTTDPLIEFSDSSDQTLTGTFAVNITSLATQATAVGSVAANLTITGGSNDTLSVSVDGTAATVTLAAGTYTAATLAAEVQSQINTTQVFIDAGSSVSVTQSGGVLTLKSNKYGSTSEVNIAGGNGRIGLLGLTPVVTAGSNVTGTIDGSSATGEGQFLTGSNAAAGLKIKVTGSTTGDRGSITFSRGYAEQLDDFLSEVLAADGVFTSITDGLNRQVSGITEERAVLSRRLVTLEARVRSRFTALDILIAQFQTTSDFLTQQLSNLPFSNLGRNNRR